MPELIGVTGKIGAGKDSIGAILTEQYGFKRVAFADALRKFAYDVNPIVFEHTTDEGLCSVRLQEFVDSQGWESAKRDNPEVRRTLQAIGVAARKNLGEDIWVHAVRDQLASDWEDVVVTDVRFPNEAQIITHLGGTVYRVVRDTGSIDTDITETALDKYDFPTIENNGSLEDLEIKVGNILAGSGV